MVTWFEKLVRPMGPHPRLAETGISSSSSSFLEASWESAARSFLLDVASKNQQIYISLYKATVKPFHNADGLSAGVAMAKACCIDERLDEKFGPLQ